MPSHYPPTLTQNAFDLALPLNLPFPPWGGVEPVPKRKAGLNPCPVVEVRVQGLHLLLYTWAILAVQAFPAVLALITFVVVIASQKHTNFFC